MKKINVFFLLFVGILGMSAITSCTPEENTDVKPTLGFISEGASITASKTVSVSEPLLFKVTANQNPNTKKGLQSLRVQSFMDNAPVKDTTVTINDDNYLGSFNYDATSIYSKEEKFTFTLTDKAGETVIETINVTTEDAPVTTGNPINTFSATLLGAQNNSTEGSFLDAHTGTVYLTSGANLNSSAVDIIYYYGSSNLATVVAPSDATVNGGAGNLSMATGMTTKNATILSNSSMTAAEFDAMGDDLDFPTSVAGTTKVNMLSVGNVIEFQTVDGKIGLFKVSNITGTDAGSMTIDVKIQQ